jgi:hypothetical protein
MTYNRSMCDTSCDEFELVDKHTRLQTEEDDDNLVEA